MGSIWPFLLYKILKYFGPRPIDCATLATLILLINVIHHHTSQLIWALLSEQVRRKNERLTDYFGIAPPKHVSSNHGFTEYKGAQSVGKDSCSLPCYCSVWFGLFVFVVFFLWTICLCTICFCTVCLCTVCFCTVYFCLVCLCSVCFVFLLFVFSLFVFALFPTSTVMNPKTCKQRWSERGRGKNIIELNLSPSFLPHIDDNAAIHGFAN